MCLALILNAINPRIGGVLIRGERGTAKSTAVRSLAALLPAISVVKGCRFGCDPRQPKDWCEDCKSQYSDAVNPDTEQRQTPFINLPVSATEDRVVGTLDIEAAIRDGKRKFEPGVLANANHGLLYIDEVNLLDDHVVDVLLDAAAMGTNIIEREGISYSHPARFMLVGTMNPEEGMLRPQLLARFGLSVQVTTIRDPNKRMRILERVTAFENDPQCFFQTWAQREKALTQKIIAGKKLLPLVKHSADDLLMIAELSTAMQVDGHRSDLVILKTARAHAAYHGRRVIQRADIYQAAQLALPHRIHRSPFDSQFEIPKDVHQKISDQVYPDRKARLEAILNDRRDHTEIDDLANEFGFYIVG